MASMALCPVSELSDDEQVQCEAGQPSSSSVPNDLNALSDDEAHEASSKRCKPAKELSSKEVSDQFRRLRCVASSKCKCSGGSCTGPFKEDPGLLDCLLQQRMMLLELPKMEADRMAPCQSEFLFDIFGCSAEKFGGGRNIFGPTSIKSHSATGYTFIFLGQQPP